MMLLGAGLERVQSFLGRGGEGDQGTKAAQHAGLVPIVRWAIIDPEDFGSLEHRPMRVGPINCRLTVGGGNLYRPIRIFLGKLDRRIQRCPARESKFHTKCFECGQAAYSGYKRPSQKPNHKDCEQYPKKPCGGSDDVRYLVPGHRIIGPLEVDRQVDGGPGLTLQD